MGAQRSNTVSAAAARAGRVQTRGLRGEIRDPKLKRPTKRELCMERETSERNHEERRRLLHLEKKSLGANQNMRQLREKRGAFELKERCFAVLIFSSRSR